MTTLQDYTGQESGNEEVFKIKESKNQEKITSIVQLCHLGEKIKKEGLSVESLSHEQKMDKAWRAIHDLGISEDMTTKPNYYVKNIYQVRDAFYSDLETGAAIEGETVEEFFDRHGIEWADGSIPDYCTQNAGDCSTCSLVNYGRDCMNNPIAGGFKI